MSALWVESWSPPGQVWTPTLARSSSVSSPRTRLLRSTNASSRPPDGSSLSDSRASVKSIWTVAPRSMQPRISAAASATRSSRNASRGVAGDPVGRVHQADRGRGDDRLLQLGRGLGLARRRDTCRPSSRSGTGPVVRTGSWRVWPSSKGIVTPPEASGEAGDGIGREARLALFAVGDDRGARRLESPERVAHGIVEQGVERVGGDAARRRRPACPAWRPGSAGCCRWVQWVASCWAGLHSRKMAPAVGFEPTTWRLTAARSTTELRRSEGPRAAARGRPEADAAPRRG